MRTHTHRFVAELNRIAGETYNSLFTLQQLRGIAGDMGLRIDGFEDFVDSLNNQGYLLKKGARVYQLQTAGF